MVASSTTFKSLMSQVDKDIAKVNASSQRRRSLYYSTEIGERKTSVIARTALGSNNRPRLTFLIRTLIDESTYTMLYLSEVDVIAVLATLDDEFYEHIKGYLVELYHDEIDLRQHVVKFDRDVLMPGLSANSLSANQNVLVIPDYSNNPEIITPFGFTISYRAFCDTLSLMLSTENQDKQKIVIVKYCLLSDIVRANPISTAIPTSLRHIRTVADVESLYEKKRGLVDRQNYDMKIFGSVESINYFQSLK